MLTTTAAALALISVAVTLTASYHQYSNATLTPPTNNKSIAIEDFGDDADDPFWDFSKLNLEDREEWTKMAIIMKKMLDDQEGTTTTQSTTSSTTKKRWSNDNEESIAQQQQQQQQQQTHQHQRRQLRETSSRQRIPPPPKLQKDEWETEASGMEGEFMEYFLEQKGKKPKQTDGMGEKIRQQRLDEMKGNDIQQRIDNKYDNNPVHKSPKRMTQSSTDVNCENSNPGFGELPCPPNDLPQKCDKYNGGDFASCFNICMESFCCIHESKNELARTCSKDLNCRHYAPCYIIWWKLQDTIGPGLIRTIQSDDFFNLPADDVTNAVRDNGFPFILQVSQHHYDDDSFKEESYALNPDNW